MSSFLLQILNSISYGSLLFMIASGFSLIFGLMKITNMVHVVFFMIATYAGYACIEVTGSYTLAFAFAVLVVCSLGFLVFRFFLYKLQGKPQSQVIICMGFLFLFDDLLLAIFGGFPKAAPTPELFDSSIRIFGSMFPKYRLVVIVVGILVTIAMDIIINRTQIGAIVRAGVDDEETVRAMGININFLFIAVYVGSMFLAAIGGVLAGPIMGMEPAKCFTLTPLVLAVVILGGLGNLRGAFYGSMIVAAIDNFGKIFFPDLAYFTVFMPMAIVLVLKPEGLFTRSANSKARKKKEVTTA